MNSASVAKTMLSNSRVTQYEGGAGMGTRLPIQILALGGHAPCHRGGPKGGTGVRRGGGGFLHDLRLINNMAFLQFLRIHILS